LFDTKCESASAHVTEVFDHVGKLTKTRLPSVGAHGFRRGTASVLEKMNVPSQKISLWLGW
jgi:hypothetical protein